MNPEPMLVPPLVGERTVTTLGSTLCTVAASESGGRAMAAGFVPLPPPPPSSGRSPTTAEPWANTKPSVPPSAPASSAVTSATTKTGPSPRRAGAPSGAVPGGGSVGGTLTGGLTTTAAGAAGSRHGSRSASDHQASWPVLPASVTIGTLPVVSTLPVPYQDYTLPHVPPTPRPGAPTL